MDEHGSFSLMIYLLQVTSGDFAVLDYQRIFW